MLYRFETTLLFNFLNLINMLKENELSAQSEIHYSCYYTRSRGGEQFIPEHAFSFQISGDLTLTGTDKVYHSGPGDFRLSRRNQLVKFLKQPPPGGEFKSVSVFLDQQTLRNFSMEYGYTAQKQYEGDSIIILKPNPLYKSFMDSLLPYLQSGLPRSASANRSIFVPSQTLKTILRHRTAPYRVPSPGTPRSSGSLRNW